jgi:uncharacterized membrane protein (DUF4010 family)
MSENLRLLGHLLIALALGVLIGAERGIAKGQPDGGEKRRFAGIRTFGLISLLGAVSIHFANHFGAVFFAASFFGFVLLVITAYIKTRTGEDVGATTEVTAILTFLYGAFCMTEYRLVAIVLAVFTALILHTKEVVHSFVSRITEGEFYATLKFAIIALVILPFLPKNVYFGFFNPYEVWLIVVIVSGIEFAGYLIMKLLPPRKGLALIGLLGGIISSTALVLNASRESKEEGTITNSLAFSSAIASSTAFLKVVILVYIVNRDIVDEVVLPMAIMFIMGMTGALLLWRKTGVEKEVKMINLRSPFTLSPALKFGVLFAFIIFLTTFGNKYFGAIGVYATSLLGGIVNINAPTVSLAQLAHGEITVRVATFGIVIATCVNTISKAGIAFLLGSKEFSRLVAISSAFPIAGAMVYSIVFMFSATTL